jgi:hypothetical protein
MQLTIDVKDSALDKVLWFLENIKSDVTIINNPMDKKLDIEPITKDDEAYKFMLKADKDRKLNPQDYGTMDDIKWD